MNAELIMEQIEEIKGDHQALHTIKSYIEGLLQLQEHGANLSTGVIRPEVGKSYNVGDHKNGIFKVKVLKNRRSKALVLIEERIHTGTRNKTAQFAKGQEIVVPFSFFKKG